MLTIHHFSKTYPGGKRAVDDLNFEVQAGEIMGFIGHNGAGKTTTLRAAAGILDFTEGEIKIDNHNIQSDSVAAKSVTAFLPDNPDLYDFLKGIDYLSFIADLYGIPREEREKRVARYAGIFGMTGALGSPIGSYSHGMKQKLALISAFIRQPKLLLLDEPFVGLDPEAAYHVKELLRQLCESGGAVLLSTHVLEVAEKLCDRIAIIREGKLVECGPTEMVVGNSSLQHVFLEQDKGENEGEIPDLEQAQLPCSAQLGSLSRQQKGESGGLYLDFSAGRNFGLRFRNLQLRRRRYAGRDRRGGQSGSAYGGGRLYSGGHNDPLGGFRFYFFRKRQRSDAVASGKRLYRHAFADNRALSGAAAFYRTVYADIGRGRRGSWMDDARDGGGNPSGDCSFDLFDDPFDHDHRLYHHVYHG